MTNRITSALRQLGPKMVLRGLLMIGALVAAGWILERYEFRELVANWRFSGDANGDFLHGPTAYVALGALFTAIGGPRQAVSFFAAYFFGLWQGVALALLASVCGCVLGYSFATGFRELARKILRGRVDVAAQFWAANAFSITLILRLLPVGSNMLVNLAAGASGLPALRFFSASALGYLPQTIVFCLFGAGLDIGSRGQMALAVIAFILSAILGLWVYARYRKDLRRAGSGDEI
jgi:uncharacterized membrane protein YdjX (TVP38/TMEM64 family)